MTKDVCCAVRPLGNRVLIKRSSMKTTKGGILLPDTAAEKPQEGEVMAVGPGKYTEEGTLSAMSVKVGDVVVFSSYAGVCVPEAEECLIVSEEDILGILAR